MLTDHDEELTKFRQINTNVEKYLKTLNKELVQVKVEKLKLEFESESQICILGAGFIGLGASPNWSHEEMPKMHKGRYRLMSEYMDKVGTHGKQMMYRTCTVQVNLDFSSARRLLPSAAGKIL